MNKTAEEKEKEKRAIKWRWLFGVLWIAETQLYIHNITHRIHSHTHTHNVDVFDGKWKVKRASSHANAHSLCLAFLCINGICFIMIPLRFLLQININLCHRHRYHHQLEIRSRIRAIRNTNFSFYSFTIFVYLQIVEWRKEKRRPFHRPFTSISTKQWDRRWNVFMCVWLKSMCQMWIIWAFLSLYYWVRWKCSY